MVQERVLTRIVFDNYACAIQKTPYQGSARFLKVVTKMAILRRFANAVEWRNDVKWPMLGMNLIYIYVI